MKYYISILIFTLVSFSGFSQVLTSNVGVNINNPYAGLTVNGSTALNVLQHTNFASDSSIGSAATTVDIYSSINIIQNTANITLTIPSPTITRSGRILTITNSGTAALSIDGNTLNPDTGLLLLWNGSKWLPL